MVGRSLPQIRDGTVFRVHWHASGEPGTASALYTLRRCTSLLLDLPKHCPPCRADQYPATCGEKCGLNSLLSANAADSRRLCHRRVMNDRGRRAPAAMNTGSTASPGAWFFPGCPGAMHSRECSRARLACFSGLNRPAAHSWPSSLALARHAATAKTWCCHLRRRRSPGSCAPQRQ